MTARIGKDLLWGPTEDIDEFRRRFVGFSSGTMLGAYRIVAPLGAGGMGEVYRARDTRLGRDVAIKVLPTSFSTDAEHLRRFEFEARTTGALNHPNLLTLFDIGSHAGSPYLISELLEGETLRSHLSRGPIPPRKAIVWAIQMAQGLAAAHAKGIVHRDLKPENLFVTDDGRIKILDFGLAKLQRSAGGSLDNDTASLLPSATVSGMVMGTAGYMSPEQARGERVDVRSDLFAFGAVLHEMLTGKRAFTGGSVVETLNAILQHDPPVLAEVVSEVPPGLSRIVHHCLEKHPDARFQSALDLAFDLEALSTTSGKPESLPTAAEGRWQRRLPRVMAAALLGAAIPGAYFLGQRQAQPAQPTFRQLTFEQGSVASARFAPDGRTVVYSASWNGMPGDVFLTRAESPESRRLGLPDAEVLAVSKGAELAIAMNPQRTGYRTPTATMARVPLTGGEPRPVLDGVADADWLPDGSLAVVRDVQGGFDLEFPLGRKTYTSAGSIGSLRTSVHGDQVAFIETPTRFGGGGDVVIMDAAGKQARFVGFFSGGLAWHPTRREVWATDTWGPAGGRSTGVFALAANRKRRLVWATPGLLDIMDLSNTGDLLIRLNRSQNKAFALGPHATEERDLSWMGGTVVTDLTEDGKKMVFHITGTLPEGDVLYVRGTDGAAPVRLGEGYYGRLSPDGKQVLALCCGGLGIIPLGAGTATQVSGDSLNYRQAVWFPDGERILFAANEPGRGQRLYIKDVRGGDRHVLSQEGYFEFLAMSPDGKTVAVGTLEGGILLYPTDGGDARMIDLQGPEVQPIRWTADGRSVFVRTMGKPPARIFKLDVSSGRMEFWRDLAPRDLAGVSNMGRIQLTPNGECYAYTYTSTFSDLWLVQGLK